MPKLMKKTWDELNGLENENYRLEVENLPCGGSCAWIMPKLETDEPCQSAQHHVHPAVRTFYSNNYQRATELLQKYGFDIELVEEK